MSAISSEQRSATEPKVLPTLPSVHWTERYFRFLWGTVGIVGCLLLWQLGSSTEVLDPLFVSSPLEVLRTALRLLPSPEFLGHLFITPQCLCLGLSIALTVVWIAIQAFAAAQVGLRFGARLGAELRERSEQVAGIALIAVALVLLALRITGV